MAASDCIKVVLFHHDQIFFYLLHIYCGTGYRIGVMTVYTFEFCFYTINIDYASLTVDFTDTDTVCDHLILGKEKHLIQIWLFRIPESGSFISFATFPSPVKFAQISIFASVPFIVVVVK